MGMGMLSVYEGEWASQVIRLPTAPSEEGNAVVAPVLPPP
jgi:hypothetical protein